MKFIDGEQIHRRLDYPALIEALAQAHRQDFDALERLLLEQSKPVGANNHFLLWPAWQYGQALGIKLVTSFPGNLASGSKHPSVQGLYVLFDGQNGQPLACLDGVALTLRKTAADSALGARFLARKDAESLLMVGAGELAPHLIAAHRTARPSIQNITLWNRTPERAASLTAKLKAEGLHAHASADLATAVRRADIISCATGASEPLIQGRWLKPGAHLDLVGGFTPAMREADDEAIRRARLYVDSRWFTLRDCGDLSQPLAAGLIDESDIVADLFELCRGGRQGRQKSTDITLFKNGGGAHLDLMVARFCMSLEAVSKTASVSAQGCAERQSTSLRR